VQRLPETMDEPRSNALIQYKKVNAIFETSLVEGITTKGRTIYVNEAQRDNYPTVLTRPSSPLGRPVFFSKEDAYAVHFPHNDTLIIAVHIDCCKVSRSWLIGEVVSISCTDTP